MVHKRCHKLYKEACRTRLILGTPTPVQSVTTPTGVATPIKVTTPGSAESSPLSEENGMEASLFFFLISNILH